MKTLLVLCVVCTLVVLSVSGTAEQKLKNCNEVRAAYSSKGFNVNDVPNKGVNGETCLCLSLQSLCSVLLHLTLSARAVVTLLYIGVVDPPPSPPAGAEGSPVSGSLPVVLRLTHCRLAELAWTDGGESVQYVHRFRQKRCRDRYYES